MPNSTFFYTLGAVHNIVDIDYKKRSEAESASFNFRIKKISAYGVDDDILEEIKKFPFPFQQLIIKEACAVMNRLENGKVYQVLLLLTVTACFAINIYCHVNTFFMNTCMAINC